jgi:tRNA pseudouridine65 synthase
MWLLAQKLSLTHPVTGTELSVVTEPEPEWQQIFTALGWEDDELCSSRSLMVAGT